MFTCLTRVHNYQLKYRIPQHLIMITPFFERTQERLFAREMLKCVIVSLIEKCDLSSDFSKDPVTVKIMQFLESHLQSFDITCIFVFSHIDIKHVVNTACGAYIMN